MIRMPLGELMVKRAGSVDPAKFPDEEFDLYSIPAFDTRLPEIARGAEIGSSKQLVRTGDVLLSRIVPHIRRAWVVGPDRGRRLIASGEWMVFRSESIDPGWLRHLLVSDGFHRRFMQTVAGVGGSLLRARPAHVAQIDVDVPPLDEQRRVASILDHADTLRAKRRKAIACLDELTQSIFIDMFGDPSSNSRGLPAMPLRDVVVEGDKINYGVVQPGPDVAVGVRLVRAGDIGDGRVDLRHLRLVSNEVDNKHRRSRLQGDEILISCVGSIGAVALATPELKGCNIARAVARVRVGEDMRREYIAACLSAPGTQRYFTKELRTVAQPTLNIKQIEEAQVIVPTLREQDQFVSRVKEVDRIRSVVLASLVAMDKLFASLQSRAFRGEL